MKVVGFEKDIEGNLRERIKHICPICGKEMNETYNGNDYCKACEYKYNLSENKRECFGEDD